MAYNSNKNNRHTMKPVEARYLRALSLMRSLRVSSETKDIQKELSWLKKEIEDLGMIWFANHYLFDKVVAFERQVVLLQNHPSTK